MYRIGKDGRDGLKKGIGERGLMGLEDCGAPSDFRFVHSTIVRYHPPVLQKSNIDKSLGTTRVKH